MKDRSSHMPQSESDIRTSLIKLLDEVLHLSDERITGFNADTKLFGALPELDSMAIATVLTEIEDRFGIIIDDDDIDGETFETLGNLTTFVATKLG